MSVIDNRNHARVRPVVTVPHTFDGQGLVTIREGKHSQPGSLQLTLHIDGVDKYPALLLPELVEAIGKAFGAKATLTLEPVEG